MLYRQYKTFEYQWYFAIFAGVWFLRQNLKIFTLLHFLYFILNFYSVGWDVKPCHLSRITTPWHAKDCFTGFWWKVGSWGPPGKLQIFKTNHISRIVAAVIWLKYCRYGVKFYPINQPIFDLFVYSSYHSIYMCLLCRFRPWYKIIQSYHRSFSTRFDKDMHLLPFGRDYKHENTMLQQD